MFLYLSGDLSDKAMVKYSFTSVYVLPDPAEDL